MAVEVGRGVKAALWRVPEHAVVQVEADASEFEAAAAGLVRGLEIYEELPEVIEVIEDQASCALQWFGDVLWLPAGPAVVVKVAEQLPKRLVERIPEEIAHAVADAGVDSARIVTPKEPRVYERFYEEPRAVMLHGFAEPARAATERIVLWEHYWDVARAWAARAGNARVWAGADVWFETDLKSLAQVFRQCGRTVIGCTAVLEDVDAGLVWCAAVTNHMAGTQIRLAVGGRGADPPRHQRAIEELTAVARDLAPDLAYAVIVLHDDFSGPLMAKLPNREKPFAQEGTVIPVVDEVVYDAFCYQVLGPRHLQRLGGELPGATPLAAGRLELALDPHTWIDDPHGWEPRTSLDPLHPLAQLPARNHGRDLLRPCILANREIYELEEERIADGTLPARTTITDL